MAETRQQHEDAAKYTYDEWLKRYRADEAAGRHGNLAGDMANLQQAQRVLDAYNPRAAATTGTIGGVAGQPVGIGNAPASGLNSTQQNAWSDLQQLLQEYGFSGQSLTQLVNWAKGEIINGSSENQITLDLMQTPQFKQRFPAIGVLAGEGIAITPADYINMEQSYAQAEQQAGLPPNFASYDALIAAQVSPSEYSARLNQGYLAVAMAPPETIQAFQDYYGVNKAQLAGYFLNPKASEPLLLQHALAAQIGGASATSGFGQVSAAQAGQLAQMGVTYPQAQTGFQKLSEEKQLEQPLTGQRQANPFTTDQLLRAQFGSNGQVAQQLQIQADLEKGYFQQGTQVASGQTGQTGTGVNQR